MAGVPDSQRLYQVPIRAECVIAPRLEVDALPELVPGCVVPVGAPLSEVVEEVSQAEGSEGSCNGTTAGGC